MKKYEITAVSKPRMTVRDRWKQRPIVLKYWKYRDQIKESGMQISKSGTHITFVLPMPKSWSRKKKNERRWKPHQQKPDIDNLIKGLLDAVFDDDSCVWSLKATKLWGDKGGVIIDEIV